MRSPSRVLGALALRARGSRRRSRAQRRVRAGAARAAERAGGRARPPAGRHHRARRRARRGAPARAHRRGGASSSSRPTADSCWSAADNRCTVVTSAPLGAGLAPGPLEAASATDLAADARGCLRRRGRGHAAARAVRCRRARSPCCARADRPFSAVERAQLRVFAAAAVRTAHNARLFTLAETLRVEAELRERERGAALRPAPARRGGRAPPARAGTARRAAAEHRRHRADRPGRARHDPRGRGRRGPALARSRARALPRRRRAPCARSRSRSSRSRCAITASRPRSASSPGSSRSRTRSRSPSTPSAIDALDRQAQVSLYRIAQEATTNAVKHAGGTRIDVTARTPREGRHRALHRRRRARRERARPAARRHAPRRRRDARARLGRRRHDGVRGDGRRRLHGARDRPAAPGERGAARPGRATYARPERWRALRRAAPERAEPASDAAKTTAATT